MSQRIAMIALTALVMTATVTVQAQTYSWQKPHAKVLPHGDLEYAPARFEFQAGETVRYIDYESGDDGNPGTKARPWKHHPWDKASRITAEVSDVDTYVFKGGVVYRGTLQGKAAGTPETPVRLTSDPTWGTGAAELVGSQRIAGQWTRVSAASAPKGLPEPGKVWKIRLGKGPRPWCLWQVDGGKITRLPLARTPNWHVEDEQMDVMADWWQWSWGKIEKVDRKVGNRTVQVHACIDAENLTLPKDAYTQAYVWTEWGPVMGTPCAREVVDFDPETSRIYFPGFWGGGGRNVYGGNRYYLENSPYFLDEAGEWWFDEEASTLYLRPTGGGSPDRTRLEIARRGTLIELESGTKNVSIRGLTFRFTNVHTPHRRFADQAVIRCMGSADGIDVSHNRFEQVNLAVRLKAAGGKDRIDRVTINDNELAYTDYGAFLVADGMRWALKHPPKGELGDVQILRNRMHHMGMRPGRSDNGHAVRVNFPETAQIAGNFLNRCYGAGLFIFGGKSSGYLGDAPMSRILIHHNRVTHCLLRTNDWGNIETWQGGPHYVFNNVSGNPWGYWNWQKRHFGFAYYMDGSFKNYQFNNIAWGTSSQAKPHGNTSAFQEIISYQNSVFNNSIFRFVVGSRRQAPQAGRDLFAGNVWEDIGDWVFWHGRPAESPDQANQADVGEVGKSFAYETMAYANNVVVGEAENFGVFEGNGMPHKTLQSMKEALAKRKTRASQLGKAVDKSPYVDAEKHDFRLEPSSPAVDYGVKVFVPWGLYAMVGEWNFARNNVDPTVAIDDHWYLTPAYGQRQDYYKVPTFPLKGPGLTAGDYVAGPLEDWTPAGALKLNGTDHYLTLELGGPKKDPAEEEKVVETEEHSPEDWITVTAPKKIVPGEPFQAVVKLKGIEAGKKVEAHLHWAKKQAWGGFNAIGLPVAQGVDGEGPYTFTFKPEEKSQLDKFSLMIFTGPGGFGDKEKVVRIAIEAGQPAGPALETLKSPAIDKTNFLIETYLKLNTGATGLIMNKMGQAGYDLSIAKGGTVVFAAKGSGESGSVTSKASLDDGQWHHVIAECDRKANRLTLYIDGKPDAWAPGVSGKASLADDAPVYVGGTPDGRNLAATLEFLRIARGTLADARTTIDELYTWQFDGPFLRDFTGAEPAGKGRDAGALECTQAD